jgi:hypothetical protein
MTRWNLMLTVLVVVMVAGLAVVLSGCGSDSTTADPDVVGVFHAYPEALNPGEGEVPIVLNPNGVKGSSSDDNIVLTNCLLFLDDDNDATLTGYWGELTPASKDAPIELDGSWEQDGNLVFVDLEGYSVVQYPPDLGATLELSFTGDDAGGGTMTFSYYDEEYDGTIVIVRASPEEI